MRAAPTSALLAALLAACSQSFGPGERSQPLTSIGDFVVTIDSVAVSADSASDGDTVAVRLFGSVAGRRCFHYTAVTASAVGSRSEITVYGYRSEPVGECHPLEDRLFPVAVRQYVGSTSWTIAVRLPGDQWLERRVRLVPRAGAH